MGPKIKSEGSPDDKKQSKKIQLQKNWFSDISHFSFEILVLAQAQAERKQKILDNPQFSVWIFLL